jgi:hypothetical protein
MAKMCKGVMDKPRSGFALFVPGLVLVILGVAVIFEPRILVWLVAGAFIVMGIGFLFFGGFLRRHRGRTAVSD